MIDFLFNDLTKLSLVIKASAFLFGMMATIFLSAGGFNKSMIITWSTIIAALQTIFYGVNLICFFAGGGVIIP